jgi:type II secretory pathway component PulF
VRAARRSPSASASIPRSSATSTQHGAAGELGGILDTILVRLANYLEKAAKLKSKIKGAMIYPACIVAAAVLVHRHPAVWVIPSSARCSRASAGAARARRSS